MPHVAAEERLDPRLVDQGHPLDEPAAGMTHEEVVRTAELIREINRAEPKLILLDEPTEGIQPSIVEEMVETLQALRRSHKLTIVLVEQDLQFINALADRVLIIQKGTITREVSPAELADPDMVAEFVGMAG